MSVAGGIVGALRRILRIVMVALFVPPGTRLQCPPVIRTLLRLDHNSFRDARDVPGDLDQGVWLLREEHLTHLTLTGWALAPPLEISHLTKPKAHMFEC